MQERKMLIRIKGDLPPTPPIPASLQTLACRWMPLGFFEWCRRGLGDRFTLYPIDLPPVVLLSHPADVRAVFNAPTSTLLPGVGGSAIMPIVGDQSFMLQDGDAHMQGRRTILPAFNATTLNEHASHLANTIRGEIESWPIERPFAVLPRLRSMSLRIILETIFGHDTDLERLHQHILAMLEVTASFLLVEPRLRHLPAWRTTWRRFLEARRLVDHEIYRLVEAHDRNGARSVTLDRLLNARDPDGSAPPHAQVRDELMSVILAGHETTASEAAWALQLVAHTPRVQARLAEEIYTDDDGPYLQATVAEVLRHRPVFLFAIPRAVAAPIQIRGWTYRPPAQLLACSYLLQHDPTIYSSPNSFRPERFLTARPEPSTWIPWGGGRKRCPGHRLATLELRIILRTALSAFTVAPTGRRVERAKWRSVIVTPGKGGRITLAPRKASRGPAVAGYKSP